MPLSHFEPLVQQYDRNGEEVEVANVIACQPQDVSLSLFKDGHGKTTRANIIQPRSRTTGFGDESMSFNMSGNLSLDRT